MELGNNISCIIDFRHLDEKKKKRKCSKVETHVEFPGREKVKFGDIVEAPPKLSFPKVPSLLTSFSVNFCTSLFAELNVCLLLLNRKSPLDASAERLRKEVVENYRNIKGWTSRPGLQLPTLVE